MSQLQLAVLASGKGTNLQSILDAIKTNKLNATVKVVLSDKSEALALKRAQDEGIPAYYVNHKDFIDKQDFEKALLEKIKSYNVDHIILAGFMRVLSSFFVQKAGVPILNIHPSLLPSFQGLNAHKQAIDYGVRFSGCTVHFVDEGVDTGPIILQSVVPVLPGDSEEILAKRILEKEHDVYPQAIQLLSEGRIVCRGRRVIIVEEGEA
ncbi:MAG: phosphoribosylglycinamide formyltransferase [Firmicutes bacterium HGW-Firmicutes-12]|jgi:phosphoribosylglycinamide formyltransferase-1|nr:MAG: phosphoribosylglycinamide formyltransferase [Firmicutes bacterium HGW-Firmicutes-12]